MLKLTCVVDHETLSPQLRGEHGLSFWIESGEQVVLFDTAQTSEVLLHNLAALDLPLERINCVVLSHAHYDHTGGLRAVLQRAGGLPVYAHTDIFQPRYSYKNGGYNFIGLKNDEVISTANFQLSTTSVEVITQLWTSGEIIQRNELTGSSPHHFILSDAGGWLPDPYRDDLSLVYQGEEGLTLICGCCHAGVLNTLSHVEMQFKKRVTNLVGGIHLAPATTDELDHVIRVLRASHPGVNYHLNHCTGSKAVAAFSEAFPGRVDYLKAGMSIVLE